MSGIPTPAGVDPTEYSSSGAFKSAVYDETGAGSWIDDLKLEIIWRRANGEELDEYMKPLVEGGSDA